MPDDPDTAEAQASAGDSPRADDFQPIAELARGYWAPRILLTAVDLDLFTALGSGSLTAAQLASHLGVQERGVGILVQALAAIGLVVRDDGRYRSSSIAARYLDRASPEYRGNSVRLASDWWKHWSALSAIVREGASARRDESDSRSLETFTLAMHEGKPQAGEMLVGAIDLHGVERIIDLGGGPGTFAEALATALPEAQVVLVDRADVLAVAERRLPAELFDNGRIALADRDFMTDGIPPAGSPPGSYDLALLSSVLHLNGPEASAALLRRVYEVLEPGGRIVIRDFLIDESGSGPPEAALFAVAMLVTTDAGRCYAYSEVKAWLNAAGFGEVERIDFDGAVKLITARRA